MGRTGNRALTAALLLLGLVAEPVWGQSKQQDEITSPLPGLNFVYTARQYSGYFSLSSQNNVHYWLLASQSQPSTDPLILW